MVMPQPTEEERRLLREYRVISIPPRRSLYSPATSNASSSTTNDNINELQLQKPQIITVSSVTISEQSNSSDQKLNQRLPDSNQDGIIASMIPETKVSSDSKIVNQISAITNSTSTNTITTEIKIVNNPPHSSQKPHHTSNNHRKLKNQIQSHELKPDELTRMLDLVSNLDCLKLASPKSIPLARNDTHDSSNNDEVIELTDSRENNNHPVRKNKSLVKGPDRRLIESKHMFNHNCSNSTTRTNDCRPYIFEKVDYIKKMSIRRKEMKKFRKARSKSSSVASPKIKESLKIML